MTDSKAFLIKIELTDLLIESKLDEISRLESMVEKITTTLNPNAGTGAGSKDKLGDAIAKIVDLENELDSDIDSLVDSKRDVSKILEQMQDPDQFRVLYKKYMEYKTLETIACEMNMTYRNICYIHGKALQTVSDLLKGKDESHGS